MRWKRMSGFDALWLPGLDHAGIATQMVVERQLAQGGQAQGGPRPRGVRGARLGVEGARAAAQILKQLRLMGFSLDWSARALHDGRRALARGARGVRVALRGGPDLPRQLHRELVPALRDRALRPRGGDASRETGQPLAHPLSRGGRRAEGDRGGDHAAGDDAGRHRRWPCTPTTSATATSSASTLVLPVLGREIPVVADAFVDREFGTGAVKVTPAHDPNDFAGRRSGTACRPSTSWTTARVLNENAGPYAGLDRFEARKAIVAQLEREGLLVKTAPHRCRSAAASAATPSSSRGCRAQWFVKIAAAGRAGDRGGGGRADPLRPRELEQDLLRLDAQHPRLVHQPAALVGAPHPGLVLRRLRRR